MALLLHGVCAARCIRRRGGSNVQDIIAPYQYFSQHTRKLSINEFFSFDKLQVHVCIRGGKLSLVLLSPLEFDTDGFSSEIFQEWLWVYNQVTL